MLNPFKYSLLLEINWAWEVVPNLGILKNIESYNSKNCFGENVSSFVCSSSKEVFTFLLKLSFEKIF